MESNCILKQSKQNSHQKSHEIATIVCNQAGKNCSNSNNTGKCYKRLKMYAGSFKIPRVPLIVMENRGTDLVSRYTFYELFVKFKVSVMIIRLGSIAFSCAINVLLDISYSLLTCCCYIDVISITSIGNFIGFKHDPFIPFESHSDKSHNTSIFYVVSGLHQQTSHFLKGSENALVLFKDPKLYSHTIIFP